MCITINKIITIIKYELLFKYLISIRRNNFDNKIIFVAESYTTKNGRQYLV